MLTTLSIIAGMVWLAVFLYRRHGKTARLNPVEMARHRLAAERERRDWIYPFD